MTVDISNIFKAVGPAASIIFAAWIFMGFLQTRYNAAVDRYRDLVGQYRDGNDLHDRRANLRDSILVYKRRCDIMNAASVVGLASAIILIIALMAGVFALIFPESSTLKALTVAGTFVGLGLVIIATGFVIYESLIIRRQLESELLDLPDLAHDIGQEPGKVGDPPDKRASR